jgi:capsular exopolysaccharide synthesis family protein
MQSEFDRLASRRVALQERQQQQNQLLQVLNLRVNDIRTPLEFLPGGAIEESGSEQGNFIAAGFLGLLVGLVVAFSKESLDRTYHNPIELARHVQRDILARVPKRPSSERALITNPSEAASFESYRLLASNLIARLARQGVEKPVTVVSSAEPNVGKTTVAANLATAVALRGNKTVLIDAAFRNPSLHEVFDLENGEGLVNALKDTAADPTKLVQATSSEQLSVLTTGSGIEESSIDLLETNRMGEIVQALSKEFDYVLVDVARAVPFADASNVARYANSGLIVFDEKKQDPDLISEAIGALEMQGAPVVGLVVNKAKKAKDLLAQK